MANIPAQNPMAGTLQASYAPGANMHFQAGVTPPDDGAYEQLQRDSGGYQPGSYEAMQDELSKGSDDAS